MKQKLDVQKAPFVLGSPSDDNQVFGVEEYKGGYKINGTNNKGQLRYIIIDKNGHATGFNGSTLGYVESLMSDNRVAIFNHFNIQTSKVESKQKSIEGAQKEEEQPIEPPKYQYIDWINPPFPAQVTEHPLWPLHQALANCKSNTKYFENKKFWALASIKSLIEIDINREFVIEAGLAYENDVDNGLYVETSQDIFIKKDGASFEFDAFRTATKNNVRKGDDKKADTLRTSEMIVSPLGEREFVSYHPSISYPTKNLPKAQRRANKEQQINYFYNGLLQIWQRIQKLSYENQQTCLNGFIENVKIGGIGCANERLVEAIDKITQVLIQHEEKKLTQKEFLNLVQQFLPLLDDPTKNPNSVFEEVFNKYSGYKIEGQSWEIDETTKARFAEEVIEAGINTLFVWDEQDRKENVNKLLGIANKQELQQFNLPIPKALIEAPKIKKALNDYNEQLTSLLKKLEIESQSLAQKAVANSEYTNVAARVQDLYKTLNDQNRVFFDNPKAETFMQFHNLCIKAFEEAEKESKNHRGWHKVNAILRGILGVLAGLTVIPALIVGNKSKHGYFQTFFATPKTDTFTTTNALKQQFENQKQQFEEQDNELSQEIKSFAN